jgi:hypothetical protein
LKRHFNGINYEKTPIIPHITDSDDGNHLYGLRSGEAVYDEFCGCGHIAEDNFGLEGHPLWTFHSRRLESPYIQPFGVSRAFSDAYARL